MKHFATLAAALALGIAAPVSAQTYSSADTPIDITDAEVGSGCSAVGTNTPITSTISVTDTGNVADLDVELDISHTWVGDLTVVLEHGGESADLLVQPGDADDGTGCGDSSDGAVFFVDDQGTDGSTEDAPAGPGGTDPAYAKGGRYTPNSPLSVFNGQDLSGDWVLSVWDDGAGDIGTLNVWSIIAAVGVNGESAPVNWSHIVTEARPNPFSASTRIGLTVPEAQAVQVDVLDMTGRAVAVLHSGVMAAGQEYDLVLEREALPSGVYVVRMVGEDFSDTRRVTVVR